MKNVSAGLIALLLFVVSFTTCFAQKGVQFSKGYTVCLSAEDVKNKFIMCNPDPIYVGNNVFKFEDAVVLQAGSTLTVVIYDDGVGKYLVRYVLKNDGIQNQTTAPNFSLFYITPEDLVKMSKNTITDDIKHDVKRKIDQARIRTLLKAAREEF